MNLISATITKDSVNKRGNRLTTLKIVVPRIILSELNTHRMFNRNSASSRAIPFRKMVKSALENPFIPIAFQKDHTGMQGSEYLDSDLPVNVSTFSSIMKNVFKYSDEEIQDDFEKEAYPSIGDLVDQLLNTKVDNSRKTPAEWWLWCRNQAVKSAILMASLGVSKQICNRILEPFIYHTVLVTATEWENFFNLRNPVYETEIGVFKSKRDALISYAEGGVMANLPTTDLEWLQINKGMGEIHIMDLAEKMYDAMNESTPDVLEDGEWHIPFNIDENESQFPLFKMALWEGQQAPTNGHTLLALKIATARCARISYETLGDNPKIDYKADVELHDRLFKDGHMSVFEHCAKAMTEDDYFSHIKTESFGLNFIPTKDDEEDDHTYMDGYISRNDFGWSRNLHGFIQYREIIEKKRIV